MRAGAGCILGSLAVTSRDVRRRRRDLLNSVLRCRSAPRRSTRDSPVCELRRLSPTAHAVETAIAIGEVDSERASSRNERLLRGQVGCDRTRVVTAAARRVRLPRRRYRRACRRIPLGAASTERTVDSRHAHTRRRIGAESSAHPRVLPAREAPADLGRDAALRRPRRRVGRRTVRVQRPATIAVSRPVVLERRVPVDARACWDGQSHVRRCGSRELGPEPRSGADASRSSVVSRGPVACCCCPCPLASATTAVGFAFSMRTTSSISRSRRIGAWTTPGSCARHSGAGRSAPSPKRRRPGTTSRRARSLRVVRRRQRGYRLPKRSLSWS